MDLKNRFVDQRILLTMSVLWLASPVLAGVPASSPSPADGMDGVVAPFFMWVATPNAAVHHVYLGLSPQGLELVAELPAEQTFYYHVPGLIHGRSYYWRVDGRDRHGVVTEGPLWSFSTWGLYTTEPEPSHGATFVSTDLTLAWQSGFTASEQEVFFGTDCVAVTRADSGWPEFLRSLDGTVNSLTLDPLEPNTTYYWRVDSLELDGSRYKGSVWSFETRSLIEVTDPNRLAWWRFDMDIQRPVQDWSGYERQGLVTSGQWTTGYTGGALALNGQSSCMTASGDGLPVGDEVATVALWLQIDTLDGWQSILGWGPASTSRSQRLDLSSTRIKYRLGSRITTATLADTPGEWVHVLVSHSGEGLCQIYLNGQVQSRLAADRVWPRGEPGSFWLGHDGQSSETLAGVVDDVRIYNRLLTDREKDTLLRGENSLVWAPQPRLGATYHGGQVNDLAWQGDAGIGSYRIYLGTDPGVVADANTQDMDVYRGEVATAAYPLAEILTKGQTYFWRVDAVLIGGEIRPGELWRFTVSPSVCIDDFESYNGDYPNYVFMTWLDGHGYDTPTPGVAGNGTGSLVGHWDPPYIEQALAYTGFQSLPMLYDNRDVPFYSEIERVWEVPQDWLSAGVTRLELYLTGQSNNQLVAGEDLYLRLHDDRGATAMMRYTQTQTAFLQTQWVRWEVVLASLAAQVDLSRITRLVLGVGAEHSSQAGGEGLIFFDDLCLYTD